MHEYGRVMEVPDGLPAATAIAFAYAMGDAAHPWADRVDAHLLRGLDGQRYVGYYALYSGNSLLPATAGKTI